MDYFKSEEVTLTGKKTEVTYDFGYEISAIAVGFSGFGLGYGYNNKGKKIDHHIRLLSLNVDGTIDSKNNKKVILTITADMYDDHDTHTDYNDCKVAVVVIAAPLHYDSKKTDYRIRTLNGFEVKYGDENHHVKMFNSYGLYKGSSCTPYIMDASGNSNSKGTSSVSRKECTLQLPEKSKIPNIISDFMVGRSSGDNDVHFIGLFLNQCTEKPEARYFLEDESKNHAEADCCCFSLGYQNKPGNSKNPAIGNFFDTFNAINTKGTKERLKYKVNFPSMELHIQGALVYSENNVGYWLLSHSDGDFMLFQDKTYWFVFNSGSAYFTHLSGMQRIGDYCVVAASPKSDMKSCIRFYDLRGMSATNRKKPMMLSNYINRNCRDACAGIAMFKDGASDAYLVAAYYYDDARTKVDFYKSPADKGLEGANFSLFGTCDLRDKNNNKIYDDFQNIGLVVEENGKIYLIGLSSHWETGDYSDHADVFEVCIDKNGVSMEHKKNVEFLPTHGTVLYAMGIHFRYAGGVEIVSSSEMNLLMTERNCNAGKLDVNVFYKK